MIKKLSGFMKKINKRIKVVVKDVSSKKNKLTTAQEEYSKATSRQKQKKKDKLTTAKTETTEASAIEVEVKYKKQNIISKIQTIFSKIFPGVVFTEDMIKNKITEINTNLKNKDSDIDYVKDQNINDEKQEIIDIITNDIELEIETIVGGGKINKTKFIQSGGNIADSFHDNLNTGISHSKILINNYLFYLLAQYSAIETVEKNIDQNIDNYKTVVQNSTEFVSKVLANLNRNVLVNNENSFDLLFTELNKAKEEITFFNNDNWVNARKKLLDAFMKAGDEDNYKLSNDGSSQFNNISLLIIKLSRKEIPQKEFLDSIRDIFKYDDKVNPLIKKMILAAKTVKNDSAQTSQDEVCDINTHCADNDLLETYLKEIDNERENYFCIETINEGNILVDTNTLKINKNVKEGKKLAEEVFDALGVESSRQTLITDFFPSNNVIPTIADIEIYNTIQSNWSTNSNLRCFSCTKVNDGIGVLGTNSQPIYFSAKNKIMHKLTKKGRFMNYPLEDKKVDIIFCPRCVKKINKKKFDKDVMKEILDKMLKGQKNKNEKRREQEEKNKQENENVELQRTLTKMLKLTEKRNMLKNQLENISPTIQGEDLKKTMELLIIKNINSINDFIKIEKVEIDKIISELGEVGNKIRQHWQRMRGNYSYLTDNLNIKGGSRKNRRKKTKRRQKKKRKTKRKKKGKNRKTKRRRKRKRKHGERTKDEECHLTPYTTTYTRPITRQTLTKKSVAL